MREIQFRGVSKRTGEWIYGYYGKLDTMEGEKHYIIVPTVTFNPSTSSYFVDHEVHEESVGQYTGQDDMNQRGIYEGDVFEGLHDFGPAGFEMRKAQMHFHETQGYQWNYWDLESIQVIGNVYDNPGLLEDGQ